MTERIKRDNLGREDVDQLLSIFDATHDAIWIIDSRQHILRCNRMSQELFGLSEEEMVGRHCWEIVHHTDAPVPECPFPRAAESRKRESMELQADGRWFEVTVDPMFDESGDLTRALHIIRDITIRKQGEEKLTESEARARSFVENSPMGVHMYRLEDDVRLVFADANAAADRILGVDCNSCIGKTIEEAFPPLADTEIPDRYRRAAREGETWQTEEIRYQDHHISGAYAVYAFQTSPGMMAALFQDITERKRSEAALRRSEQRFRTAGKAAFDLIYEWDVLTDRLEWFGDIDRLLGFKQGEISRDIAAWIALIHPEDRGQMADAVDLHRQSTQPIRYRYRIRNRAGAYRFWTDHALPLLDSNGRPEHWVGVCTDITERKQAEQALQESEERFRSITEQMMDMIFLTDDRGTITYISPASLAIFKCAPEEMVGRPFTDFLAPEEVPVAMDAFRKGIEDQEPAVRLELKMRRKSGEFFIGEITGRLYAGSGLSGTIGVIRDVTDRRRAEDEKLAMEAQLRQAQKLESIGTLASGVAHEVNNPLTGIINYAELMKDRIEDDERALEYSNAIIEEGNRIASIVRNLLAFSRQDEAPHSLTRVSDVVAATLSLLRASLRRHQIEIVVHVPESLPEIRCRSQQIQQVLVNLLTNAEAALNERYPEYDEDKILSISASEWMDEGGQWLRVIVEDHGSGIPETVKDRVFDPFFTSKSRDQGTGLGLSVSHGIIQDHGGRLTFESEEGQGTRFFVDLPIKGESTHPHG